MNESLLVDADNQIMYLRSMGMFSGGDRASKLSQGGGAELLEEMFKSVSSSGPGLATCRMWISCCSRANRTPLEIRVRRNSTPSPRRVIVYYSSTCLERDAGVRAMRDRLPDGSVEGLTCMPGRRYWRAGPHLEDIPERLHLLDASST